MSADLRGSYGALLRDQRTQVKFHLGVRDLETGLLKTNPLIKSEMIGSAVQSAALENFSENTKHTDSESVIYSAQILKE